MKKQFTHTLPPQSFLRRRLEQGLEPVEPMARTTNVSFNSASLHQFPAHIPCHLLLPEEVLFNETLSGF